MAANKWLTGKWYLVYFKSLHLFNFFSVCTQFDIFANLFRFKFLKTHTETRNKPIKLVNVLWSIQLYNASIIHGATKPSNYWFPFRLFHGIATPQLLVCAVVLFHFLQKCDQRATGKQTHSHFPLLQYHTIRVRIEFYLRTSHVTPHINASMERTAVYLHL